MSSRASGVRCSSISGLAYGGVSALTFHKDGSVDVERLPLREEVIDDLESNLIIYYSGVERAASSVLKEQAKTITTAKILDAALVTLNTQAGTASIITAVQINVIPSQGATVSKQTRLVGQLTRTASGWKLTALGQAPVGSAG